MFKVFSNEMHLNLLWRNQLGFVHPLENSIFKVGCPTPPPPLRRAQLSTNFQKVIYHWRGQKKNNSFELLETFALILQWQAELMLANYEISWAMTVKAMNLSIRPRVDCWLRSWRLANCRAQSAGELGAAHLLTGLQESRGQQPGVLLLQYVMKISDVRDGVVVC